MIHPADVIKTMDGRDYIVLSQWTIGWLVVDLPTKKLFKTINIDGAKLVGKITEAERLSLCEKFFKKLEWR